MPSLPKFLHFSRLQKLYFQTFLTFLFFLLEAVVGYAYGSISLIADAFHMLSDLLGLGVAIYAIHLAKRTKFSDQLSFGFQRAEVLGALINAVFLLALCFTIYMEAIQRFFERHEVSDPKMILIVGSAGAVVNIIGVVMFGGHHHEHGEEPKLTLAEEEKLVKEVFSETASRTNIDLPIPIDSDVYQQRRKSSMVTVDIYDDYKRRSRALSVASSTSTKSSRVLGAPVDGGNLNMHGVFLHMLGDLLGSITVIIAALVMWLATGWEERWIIDPIVSILITTAIVSFTMPLARTSARILLQATPGHISHGVVKRALLLVPGVQGVHELHMWQLSDEKTVASVHVRLTPEADVLKTTRAVKEVMCGFGICATTVQPEQLPAQKHRLANGEWSDEDAKEDDADTLSDVGCLVRCQRETCQEKYCCTEDRVRNENNERVTYGGFWFGLGPAAELVNRSRAGTRRVSRAWGAGTATAVSQQHRQSHGPGCRRRSSAMLEQSTLPGQDSGNRRSVHFH